MVYSYCVEYFILSIIYAVAVVELFLPDSEMDDGLHAPPSISLHDCFVQFTSPEELTETRVRETEE